MFKISISDVPFVKPIKPQDIASFFGDYESVNFSEEEGEFWFTFLCSGHYDERKESGLIRLVGCIVIPF